MKIKYLRAKNFLSIGEDPVEIDFTRLGPIINIRGENGSGKTTIFEAIIYGFYGKLMKGLNHKEVINGRSRRGLEIEIQWDEYTLIRRRSPDQLLLFRGEEDITLGGIPATNDLICNIVRLNHTSFKNVFYFGQHNQYSFLSCTPEEKRSVVENLLSIDNYLQYAKRTKEKLKTSKDTITHYSSLYENTYNYYQSVQKKIKWIQLQHKQWQEQRHNEIIKIKNSLLEKNKKIEELQQKEDSKNYLDAKQELEKIDQQITQRKQWRSDLHAAIVKLEKKIEERKDEHQSLTITCSNLEREDIIINRDIEKSIEEIEKLKSKDSICPACNRPLPEDQCSDLVEQKIEKLEKLLEQKNDLKEKNEKFFIDLKQSTERLQKMEESRKDAVNKELSNLSSLQSLLDRRNELLAMTQETDIQKNILLLQKEIEFELSKKEELEKELHAGGPYIYIKKDTEEELESLLSKLSSYREEIETQEKLLPYYEYWIQAFGDNGIRSFVISEIMPILNARINYWLQFVDSNIKLTFNNNLEEVIERTNYDNNFVYKALSGGEYSRTNLAISQAFSYVMMMIANACPSIVALDECTAHFDQAGKNALYRMICELSRERQVMVVTHDQDFLDLLSRHDVLETNMENGTTKLKYHQ